MSYRSFTHFLSHLISHATCTCGTLALALEGVMTTTFLEEIKTRLDDATKRLTEASQALQMAQHRHQSLAAEVGSYQKIMEVEARRLHFLQLEKQQPQGHHEHNSSRTISATTVAAAIAGLVEPPRSEPENGASDVSKTELIRLLIEQHPTGINPAQLWTALKGQVTHRQYIYSVLKRLKDRKQVTERRGKYFIQAAPKPESEKEAGH
jgi:hypothetical protein